MSDHSAPSNKEVMFSGSFTSGHNIYAGNTFDSRGGSIQFWCKNLQCFIWISWTFMQDRTSLPTNHLA